MIKMSVRAYTVIFPVTLCLVLSGFFFLACAWSPFNDTDGMVMAAAAMKNDTGNVTVESGAEIEEGAMITVNFVRKDKTTGNETSLGTAVLKDGVLDVSRVTDAALADRLNQSYTGMSSRMGGNKIMTEMVEYQPGTREQLLGIALDVKLARQFDFISKKIQDDFSEKK